MQGWSAGGENDVNNGCSDISRTYGNVMNENINRVLGECNSRVLQYQSKVATPSKCKLHDIFDTFVISYLFLIIFIKSFNLNKLCLHI